MTMNRRGQTFTPKAGFESMVKAIKAYASDGVVIGTGTKRTRKEEMD
jgi:hypothetical protein